MDDREASRRATARGLAIPPLSDYWIGKGGPQGLIVGYATLPEAAIDPAMARLAEALSAGAPSQA